MTTCQGFAAHEAHAALTPFRFERRSLRADDGEMNGIQDINTAFTRLQRRCCRAKRSGSTCPRFGVLHYIMVVMLKLCRKPESKPRSLRSPQLKAKTE